MRTVDSRFETSRFGTGRGSYLATAVVVALAATFVATGCGDDETKPAATAPTAATTAATPAAGTVDVVIKEYTVEPNPASVPAGEVTFNVTNEGALDHEMLVIKTDLSAKKLPRNPKEPERVDEDSKAGMETIGEVEAIKPGKSSSKSFDLKAGKYVLLCNITGHYTSGQYTDFEVK